MTFRRRIALLAGLSFAAAVVACSVVGYLTVRAQMLERIDTDLRGRVATGATGIPELADRGPLPPGAGRVPRGFRPTDVLFQLLGADGTIEVPPDQEVQLPVDDQDLAIAASARGTNAVRDVSVDGDRFRMITASSGGGLATQVARPLAEVETTLARFARASVIVSLVGSALAAAVGWWVARRSARPVRELTVAAEHVADTLALDTPDVQAVAEAAHADDEIGRLAGSISRMLDALRRSRDQQQRLVMDASHEFRTPLTSLRANAEMLERTDLDPDSRAEVLADVRAELRDLTELATELVELATDTREAEQPTEVDVGTLAGRVAQRARKRHGRAIEVELRGRPWTALARPTQLERMLQNLVDNAAKYSPSSTPIRITIEEGALAVRDHGAGVPPAERELIFERFYRCESARAMPGSGLGLAVVRQIVEAHDGAIEVSDAPGGGAVFTVRLPTTGAPSGAGAG